MVRRNFIIGTLFIIVKFTLLIESIVLISAVLAVVVRTHVMMKLPCRQFLRF